MPGNPDKMLELREFLVKAQESKCPCEKFERLLEVAKVVEAELVARVRSGEVSFAGMQRELMDEIAAVEEV